MDAVGVPQIVPLDEPKESPVGRDGWMAHEVMSPCAFTGFVPEKWFTFADAPAKLFCAVDPSPNFPYSPSPQQYTSLVCEVMHVCQCPT